MVQNYSMYCKIIPGGKETYKTRWSDLTNISVPENII